MIVFNNQQRSGYEEIASYSPRFYRGIKEMDAIFRLEEIGRASCRERVF